MNKTPKNKTKKIPQNADAVWLNYSWIILLFVSISCFFSSIHLGLTNLDDSILIGNREYLTTDWKNIFYLFKVGCFHEKDVYYRPILSIYFFICNALFGTESFVPYHLLSVVIHAINVLLINKFLQKIVANKENAFLLSLLFAVHPAFTMAISWIPGVNDLLLMLFAMIYFLSLLYFFESKKTIYPIVCICSLWLAFFTKENAVFLPFVGLLLLWYKNYLAKENLKKIGFIAAFTIVGWGVWYIMRLPILKSDKIVGVDLVNDYSLRIFAILHYFGKAVLPINLCTVPTSADLSIWVGYLSLVLFVLFIGINKTRITRNIILGVAWFLILFMMIWAVHTHNSTNIIEYEHRLYLPFIGILILLNETFLFAKIQLKIWKRLFIFFCVAISFFTVNNYTKAFDNAESFWSNASEGSSKSAFAKVSLGNQQLNNGKTEAAIINFKKAYLLDSTEKYVRYYLARTIYIPQKKLDTATYFINQEIKVHPDFQDLYIALAQINFYKNDFIEEEKNLEKCVSINPKNMDAANSLLKLQLQLHHFKKAKKTSERLIQQGININSVDLKLIADSAIVSKY